MLRALVLGPDEASARRQQIDFGMPGDEPLALIQHVTAVTRIGGDHGHADERPPMQVEVTRFGGRYVIAPA